MIISESTITRELLNGIAQHLSGRPDCRHVEYAVTISPTGSIKMKPNVKVFPNIHNRKTQETVIYHVLKNHMPKEVTSYSRRGILQLHNDYAACGTYIYKLSVNKKSRRWMKVTE